MTKDAPAPAAVPAPDASDTTASPREKRSLGSLRMVWRAGLAYPGRLGMALAALVVTALSTLAVPMVFRLIVDRAFAPGKIPTISPSGSKG
jgi:ATP-binding cassette subfamily B protein